MPERVRVVRPHHPLEGRWLEVIGCTRRRGALGLIVVLPDGSRRVIPAEWTDVHGPRVPQRLGTLGSVEDLLAARRVVDGLLRAVEDWESRR
ncbi:MAG: hypothetical protein JO342_00880 [Solirubrobacterales bacterium]|nr:hypothetical protein [Solirubrobacterales bacterium]